MTRGHSVPLPRRILAGFLIVSLFPPFALANPRGGQVRQGQVRIQNVEGQLRVHQESQRAVIDWESFSIDRGEVTRFLQPNANAAALNRVRGAAASRIEGMLRANGKVYLINPNGILIGPSGSIDVGGFVASTLDTDDGDFMRGRDLRFAGNSDAAIINLGSISALDGDVVLMAGSVLNEGRIRAPRGTAALAAGNDILLTESGEERVFVRGSGGAKKANGVTNTGEIEANIAELKAHGGNIYGMAVKNEGRVAATGVTRSGGQIFLSAGGGKVRSTGTLTAKRSDGSGGKIKVDSGTMGKTEIGGTVDASGGHGAGGEIAILGNEIEVFEGTLILNDGETMGGATRIGGGRRGEDPAFANAENIVIGGGTRISASATGSGDGGEVIVFANGTLVFDGFISAHAGERGDGGFVELSGKRSVSLPNLVGRLDLSAPNGNAGTLLYDPIDISILAGNPVGGIGGSPVSQNTLYSGDIADFLDMVGNLIVTTDSPFGEDWGDITMEGTANITWSSANSLTFLADNDFILSPNAIIQATGGGSLSVTAARSIQLGAGSAMMTTHGNLTLSANQQVSPTAGNFAAIHVNGGTVRSLGTGAVSLTGLGGDIGGNNYGVYLNGGAQVLGGTTGELTITGYGGAGSGPINAGIVVSDFGTLVSSLGGNVILSGSGGNALTSDGSSGVLVTGSSTITSGTGASVTIVGLGGAGDNYNNRGVFIVSPYVSNPTTVSTGGGNLQITGTGGGTSTSLGDHGVDIAYGNSFPNVGSNGGTVTITGYVGLNPLNQGVSVDGNVNTTGNQNIQIYADRLDITGGATINSGAGTTQLLPTSNGFEINVGGADTSTSLGITDGELDRINAGTVLVGSTTSGLLTVSAPITSGNHLFLLSGAGAVAQSSIAMAANRNLRIETLGTSLGTLSLATADAALSASGIGAITLMSPRDIILTPGSSVTTVNGNINLSANQNSLPTPGSFSGIDLNAANLSSTGTGSVILWGRGGDGTGNQHGIRVRGGASLTTTGQNLTLTGVSLDPVSSGLSIELATLGADGGTIDLRGDGVDVAINAIDSSAMIGRAGNTVLLGSLSGNVNFAASLLASRLQVRDLSGLENVDFSLTNAGNNVDQINAYSNGEGGLIGSLDFRDADGFRVTEFLGSSGISAINGISLTGAAYGSESILVDRPVTSLFGDIAIKGRDIVVDATEISTEGYGVLTLEAGRAILIQGDSLLSVTDGNLGLSANRNEVAVAGNFTGITILGSRVQSLGFGGIALAGTGGDGTSGSDFSYPAFTNPSSNGIRLDGGTVISSSDSYTNDFGIELYGGGGGSAADSVGIVIAGADTILSTAGRSILIEGFGGGISTGQRNRGVHFSGGLIQACNQGNITLFGQGGAGFSENDGIQLNGGASVRAADGGITLDGYAGDTLGIGVMLGNNSGGLAITGSGSVDVKGSGSNAEGIFLGNSSLLIGGAGANYVDLYARAGNLRLQRNVLASGGIFLNSDFGSVFVEAAINSENGDIGIGGGNITIDAPVTANIGDITLTFGLQEVSESGTEVLETVLPPFDGIAAVNNILSAGGDLRYNGGLGSGDLLTFVGFSISKVDFDFASLTDVEQVVGSGAGDDLLNGPSVASIYQFTRPDEFTVGGVSFSDFENVLGGVGDDRFVFTGSASLGGHLDGGGGGNTLDYSAYGTGVVVDLEAGAATGIVGGFENIAGFTGSGNIDTITGPGSASTYEFTAPDAMQVGTVSVSGFENLIAGPLEDEFIFHPGSSLSGTLDGGASTSPVANHLNYSLYGAPVVVNLGGTPLASTTGISGGFSNLNRFTGSSASIDQFVGPNLGTNYQITGPNAFTSSLFAASGFENLSGGPGSDTFKMGPGAAVSGRLSGGIGSGTDTMDYSLFGRSVTVNVGPNTATGIAGGFSEVERIIGSIGNDRFNFLDQATIQFVDGGGGTDLLEINDSDLGGDNTYDIAANSVSRNPLYTFNNFEALRLFLGRGNNTVNSGFFPYTQFIHGGRGFNTLNLPGVSSLNEGNPIQNVYHYGISAPRPEGPDTGGLLQLEINQRNSDNPNAHQGFNTENRFSIVDPGTLSQQIGALSGAFAAAITAQASLIVVDGNPYLVFRPFSLDGSGISPSNLAIDALNESLGVDANLELAAAIGYTGPIFLFNPDGAHGLDLSGDPIDPALLTILQESLAIAAAAELSAALGLNLVVSVTATDGIIPTSLDNAVPGQPVVLLLTEQLGEPAFNELNAALRTN